MEEEKKKFYYEIWIESADGTLKAFIKDKNEKFLELCE